MIRDSTVRCFNLFFFSREGSFGTAFHLLASQLTTAFRLFGSAEWLAVGLGLARAGDVSLLPVLLDVKGKVAAGKGDSNDVSQQQSHGQQCRKLNHVLVDRSWGARKGLP